MTHVPNSTGRLRRVLLCPPTHFRFQPINEITNRVLANGEEPDLEAFAREHAEFVDAYRTAGVEVELMQPVEDLPYMVYARDFGACLAEGALIGSFKEPIRQGEELHYETQAAGARPAGDRQGHAGRLRGRRLLVSRRSADRPRRRRRARPGRACATPPRSSSLWAIRCRAFSSPAGTCTWTWPSISWLPVWRFVPPSRCPTSSCACCASDALSSSKYPAKASSATTAISSAWATTAFSPSPGTRGQ